MTTIGLEININKVWHRAGSLTLLELDKGFDGRCVLDYDTDYITDFVVQDIGKHGREDGVIDHRAFSVLCPAHYAAKSYPQWPSFLVDLMPQGYVREQLEARYDLKPNDRACDLQLLMETGANPIGNVRITEATDLAAGRRDGVELTGIRLVDVATKSPAFKDLLERFPLLMAGSSPLQGAWPKMALVADKDGLYYPDGLAPNPTDFLILKLGKDEQAKAILQGEAAYLNMAPRLGLRAGHETIYVDGLFATTRFDRIVEPDGVVCHGQESITSAAGLNSFGSMMKHEAVLEIIRKYASFPDTEVVEYIKRDILNMAIGNPDNHGRNTALQKRGDGVVQLTPIFDLAPMRLAKQAIIRSIKWDDNDIEPDWYGAVRQFVSAGRQDEAMASILGFAELLEEAPRVARELGAPDEVMSECLGRLPDITRRLKVDYGVSNEKVFEPATPSIN